MPPGMHSAPLQPALRMEPANSNPNESVFSLNNTRNIRSSVCCVKRVSKPILKTCIDIASMPSTPFPTPFPTPFTSTSVSDTSVVVPTPIRRCVPDLFEDIYADAPPTANHTTYVYATSVSRISSEPDQLDYHDSASFELRYEDAVEEGPESRFNVTANRSFYSISQRPTTSSSISLEVPNPSSFCSTETRQQNEVGVESKLQVGLSSDGKTDETFRKEIKDQSISESSLTNTNEIENGGDTNASDPIMPSQLLSRELVPDFEFVSSVSLEEVRTPRRAATTPGLYHEIVDEKSVDKEAKRVVSLGNNGHLIDACAQNEHKRFSFYSNDTSSLPCTSAASIQNTLGSKQGFLKNNGHLKTLTRLRRVKRGLDDPRSVGSAGALKGHSGMFESRFGNNPNDRGQGVKGVDGDDRQDCFEHITGSKNECRNGGLTQESTICNNESTPRFRFARFGKKIRGLTNFQPPGSALISGTIGLGRLSIQLNSLISSDAGESGKVGFVVKQALSGRASLENVLDVIESCPGKLPDSASLVLQKYLSSTSCIDDTLSLILDDDPVGYDTPLSSRLNSIGDRLKKRRDQVTQLYLSASPNVRRAFFSSANVRSQMMQFFTEPNELLDGDTDGKEVPTWVWRAGKLAQLLIATLSDRVLDVVEMLSTNRGCLKGMATTFCSVPEVSAFLIKLCVGDALVLRGSGVNDGSLLVGEANASGIILLEKENVSDALVSAYVAACDAIKSGQHSSRWSAQAGGAAESIFEMCRRVMLLPRFSESNCTYSSTFVVEVNCALGLLGLWGASKRIGIMFDKSLEVCLSLTDGKACSDDGNTHSMFHSVLKSVPLITVINHVTELLMTVYRGRQDTSAAVKRAIESADIGPIVRCVISRGDKLLKIIEEESICLSVKEAVVRLLAGLLQSGDTDVHGWFLSRKVARRLVEITRRYPQCCVLHAGVTSCLQASIGLAVREKRLVRAWAKAVTRDEQWNALLEGCEKAKCSTLAKMVKILSEAWDDGLEEDSGIGIFGEGVRLVQKWSSEPVVPCGGLKPEGPKLCILANAESLAARIHDVDAI